MASMSDAIRPDDTTLPILLNHNAVRLPDQVAYREKEFGIWQSWSWAETHGEIEALALGLVDCGARVDDRIAIVGRNRPHLYWSMTATQCAGAIPVPVYHEAVADELAYVLEHCGARFLIAGDQEQVDKVLALSERLPDLEAVIYLDPRGLRNYDHERLRPLSDIMARGRAADSAARKELAKRTDALTPHSTAVILYTSGTTGNPKGVVLSHRNVIASAAAAAEFDALSERETTVAYLPMAWVGDYIFSVAQAYWTGFCVCCPESQDTLMADLREIGPSYFFAPPRIFETLLTTVMIRMEDAGRMKKRMFDYFMAHARRHGVRIMAGDAVGLRDRLLYRLGDLLVYGPLKNVLGFSNIRVGYTAGEAIGPEIFDFFRSIGINLKQLYGQTEASVFITLQPDGAVSAEAVGIASPGVELRIADSGEVFFRSPGVFVEYFRNREQTEKTKDADGWVSTGDAGFIEPHSGQLRIIDRAKDVGKMKGGGLFAPKFVENKLKFFPSILEAVVFGAGRERCTAIINIDLTAVGNWAERNRIAYASYQELTGLDQVLEMIRSHVESVNRDIAGESMLGSCQIERFLVLHKELDADDGELTRTRKVRRRFIEEKYGDLIRALDEGRPGIRTETEVTYEDGRKGVITADLQICTAAISDAGQLTEAAA